MTDETEMVGKVADATKEVAKTSGKAIEAADKFFSESVFGDLITDGVGLLRDLLRFYRFERAQLLAEKTKRRLEAQGIDITRPVPPKIALPLIENATIEENDDLHSLWADLLAASMDPSADDIEPRFINSIKEMMPEDRRLLEYAWEHRSHFAHVVVGGEVKFEEASNNKITGFSINEIDAAGITQASLERLINVGLFQHQLIEAEVCNPATIKEMIESGGHGFGRTTCIRYGDPRRFAFTKFGFRFCETVIANAAIK